MAKMGSRKHLKTYKAPKTWPIHPKEDTWTVKPSAGSHSIENSLSLTLVIRDILKLADNSREAKRIINSGNVLVDGRVIKDYKFPVGFMDIIEIPKTGEVYRVLLDKKGRLQLNKIEENDSKLCKIVNKSTIKGGKIQVNLHDGKNVIIDENDYNVGDVIDLKVPDHEINEVFELKEGASGKWTFNLKATNGQVIGTSQAYETESGAKNGIASVKTNALEATVKEVEG